MYFYCTAVQGIVERYYAAVAPVVYRFELLAVNYGLLTLELKSVAEFLEIRGRRNSRDLQRNPKISGKPGILIEKILGESGIWVNKISGESGNVFVSC